VLEPVRDILAQEFIGKKSGGDTVWLNHLRGEVPRASIELQAILEQRVVNVSTVVRWKPGTILLLNRRQDDPVDLTCEGTLIARALIAERDGRVALQVEEFFGHPANL
jgi:flagellar motor switch protein FliM